jgi:hypothetical protein
MKKHAIVIGGSGMLGKATLWLTENDYHVSLAARNQEKLKWIENQASDPNDLSLYSVDYYNDGAFTEAIKGAINENGPVELVVAWIHSTASNALRILTDVIAPWQEEPWRLFHIKGSTRDIPKEIPDFLPKNCHYHQVFLGFVIEGSTTRWLTHDEISTGTIRAIDTTAHISVVGTMEPWDMRP